MYTLYGDDGYIIATIVVGDDAAASTNYVFVTSTNASSESYSADADEHVWVREVIVNGALTELKEVGDELTYIGSKNGMDRGEWWKVSYNTDGEVVGAEQVSDLATLVGDYDDPGDIQVTDDIKDVEGNDDLVLLVMDLHDALAGELSVKGWTLYTDRERTEGFAIADDAKAVLIERVDGKQFGETTYYDSKEDNVADLIDDLADDHNIDGYLFAIFEDSVATSIIVMDDLDQLTNNGGAVVVPEDVVVVLNADFSVTVYSANGVVPSTTDAVAAINAELLDAGYDEVSVRVRGGVYYFTAVYTMGGITVADEYTFNPVTDRLAEVTYKVNGTSVTSLNNVTVASLGDGYIVDKNNDLATGTVKNGEEYKTGMSAVTGNKGTVYGVPGQTGADAAFEGTYVSDGASNNTAVSAIKFPAKGTTEDYTDNTGAKDGYFLVTFIDKSGSQSTKVAAKGAKISTLALGDLGENAKVGDEVMTATAAGNETVTGDVTVDAGYIAVSLQLPLGAGVASAELVSDNGYAKQNTKVTVNVTVGQIAADQYVKLTRADDSTYSAEKVASGETVAVQITLGDLNDTKISVALSDDKT